MAVTPIPQKGREGGVLPGIRTPHCPSSQNAMERPGPHLVRSHPGHPSGVCSCVSHKKPPPKPSTSSLGTCPGPGLLPGQPLCESPLCPCPWHRAGPRGAQRAAAPHRNAPVGGGLPPAAHTQPPESSVSCRPPHTVLVGGDKAAGFLKGAHRCRLQELRRPGQGAAFRSSVMRIH